MIDLPWMDVIAAATLDQFTTNLTKILGGALLSILMLGAACILAAKITGRNLNQIPNVFVVVFLVVGCVTAGGAIISIITSIWRSAA